MKYVVIGAGASGLSTAINLARKGNIVTILEKNSAAGKKLLLTGNGKCNFWNEDQDINHYFSSSGLYKGLVSDVNITKAQEFLKSLGFIFKSKDGYLYPNSNQSLTVLNCLLEECNRLKVEIIYNFEVKSIIFNNEFIINGTNTLYCDKIVLASGSCSYPKTGSTGDGYELAKGFGHNIVSVYPALVPLTCNAYYLNNWAGVRQDVQIELLIDNNVVKKEIGEIQLTDYGISGICVMQLSNMAIRALKDKKTVFVNISFLPNYNYETFNDYLKNLNQDKSLIEVLCGIVNKKLAEVILELCKLSRNEKLVNVKNGDKELLIKYILNFPLEITGSKGYDNAQTVSGGVDLTEINLKNMESKIQKGLYFTGEIIDCHGDCGGYNLSLAWITSCLVGDAND